MVCGRDQRLRALRLFHHRTDRLRLLALLRMVGAQGPARSCGTECRPLRPRCEPLDDDGTGPQVVCPALPNGSDIGPSRLHWDGEDLIIEIDEWTVPVPRKVKGTIRVTAPFRTRAAFELDGKGRHFWQPIAPAARVAVDMASPDLQWTGEAYLDSNWGSEPLEDGFRYWNWSRAALRGKGAGESDRVRGRTFYDAVTRDGDVRHWRCGSIRKPTSVMYRCPTGRPCLRGRSGAWPAPRRGAVRQQRKRW